MPQNVHKSVEKSPQNTTIPLGLKPVWTQIKYFWVLPGFSQTGSRGGPKPAVYHYYGLSNGMSANDLEQV